MMKPTAVPRSTLLALTLIHIATLTAGEAPPLDGRRYLESARRFADTVLEHGRDTYGRRHSPLFVDGLQVETLEPVRWKKSGQTWVLCNFASQQALLRSLDGLTALTGDARYREAAEAATREALLHLRSRNGILFWGGHVAWDLDQDRAVGEYADVHEQKNHQPYYPLLWRVNAAATRQVLEAIWATHIVDWSLLDFNRHASTEKMLRPQWDHAFLTDHAVPFSSVANNLSFANVTPPLLSAGVALAVLGHDTNALTWTRRLVFRWQQARDPKTGLSGGHLSYPKQDRAQAALGHVHPEINEAKIVATYHRVARYHRLPLAQMQAAELLLAAGDDCAAVGREFIRWAADDLKTYFKNCYQAQTGQFIAVMTDGTPIQAAKSRPGYYNASSFAPARPDGNLLWGAAMAFRLTRDEALWDMTRTLARELELGDFGESGGAERKLRLATPCANTSSLYALLELARATGDRNFLRLAAGIADNLLKLQTPTGLFPRPDRKYARTGDEIPLALLHLAGAMANQAALLPPATLDHAYFHCQHDGDRERLNPDIQDNRTYDHVLFYGRE